MLTKKNINQIKNIKRKKNKKNTKKKYIKNMDRV